MCTSGRQCLPKLARARARGPRHAPRCPRSRRRRAARVSMAPKKKKDDKKGSGGAEDAKARPSTAPVKAEPPPEDVEDESEEAQQTGTKRDGADVSKVTDYVEQQEMDHAKASKAIASLTDSMDTVDEEAEAKREKELAAVKINQERLPVPATRKHRHHRAARRMGRLSTHSFGPPLLQEDVDAIAQEMELDKAVAERKLREHNGDAVQTLVTLVSA